jgi:predicted transcriptional regulator
METTRTRNFHVPLPDDVYEELRTEADRSRTPATVLARRAIESWLQQRRKALQHHAIAEYATRYAGSEADLDEGLEAASGEHLHAEFEDAS